MNEPRPIQLSYMPNYLSPSNFLNSFINVTSYGITIAT